MNIRCDYGKPVFTIGSIVSYNCEQYIVISSELNFDNYKYQYELIPYKEDTIEYVLEDKIESVS